MRITLTTLFTVLLFSANAQIEKGTSALGGNIGFNFQSREFETQLNLSVAPDLLFFVAKNTAIGARVGYFMNYRNYKLFTTDEENVVSQNHQFFVGPVFRHYFRITDKFYVFSGATVYYSIGQYRVGDFDKNGFRYVSTSQGAGWEVGPGIAFFPSKNVALEIAPQYRGSYSSTLTKEQIENPWDPNNESSRKTTEVTHNFFLEIGFRYFFRKEKK